MLNASQVNDLLEKLGSGELNSREFLERFIVMSHNLHQCEDPEAVRLCRLIESRVARIAAGHLDMNELQKSFEANAAPPMSSIIIEQIEYPKPLIEENVCVPFSASGSFSPEFGAKNSDVQAQMIPTCP
jgi:hypothetical protein